MWRITTPQDKVVTLHRARSIVYLSHLSACDVRFGLAIANGAHLAPTDVASGLPKRAYVQYRFCFFYSTIAELADAAAQNLIRACAPCRPPIYPLMNSGTLHLPMKIHALNTAPSM